MSRFNTFKSCPECREKGKPCNTEYNDGFICLNAECRVIYYGKKI